jgi:Ca2+-dependent lipid-binding protein
MNYQPLLLPIVPDRMAATPVIHIRVIEGRKIPSTDFVGKSDPYCLLQLSSGNQICRTKVKDNSSEPVWNEDFSFAVHDVSKDVLHVLVKDSDLGALSADDPISRGKIPLCELKIGEKYDRWVVLEPAKNVKTGGEIHVWLQIVKDGSRAW